MQVTRGVGRAVCLAGLAALMLGLTTVPAAHAETSPPFRVKLKMMPKKAGTEDHPKGVKVSVGVNFEAPVGGRDSPVLLGGRLFVPRGVVFNGADYPACSLTIIRRDESTENCPKQSIMGTSGKGMAHVEPPFGTQPQIIAVNGGARRIWAFATYYNPAFVQEPIGIKVRPLTSRRWSYELSFEMPAVLRIVAGVPMGVPPNLRFNLGGKPYARNYITTERRCPKRGFRRYEGSLSLEQFPDRTVTTTDYRGRIACR